jgi:hypothetical protein
MKEVWVMMEEFEDGRLQIVCPEERLGNFVCCLLQVTWADSFELVTSQAIRTRILGTLSPNNHFSKGSALSFIDLELEPNNVRTEFPTLLTDWSAESVFLLSVSRDTRRLEMLDEQLTVLGLNYGLVFAPDSTKMDLSEYTSMCQGIKALRIEATPTELSEAS